MKKIALKDFIQTLLKDETLKARLLALAPKDKAPAPEAVKALAAELGYELELPEDDTPLSDDMAKGITGGDTWEYVYFDSWKWENNR